MKYIWRLQNGSHSVQQHLCGSRSLSHTIQDLQGDFVPLTTPFIIINLLFTTKVEGRLTLEYLLFFIFIIINQFLIVRDFAPNFGFILGSLPIEILRIS